MINEYEKFQELTKDLATGKRDLTKDPLYPGARSYFDTLNKHLVFHKITPLLGKETPTILRKSELFNLKDRGTNLGELPTPYQSLMENLSKIENKWNLF